MTRLSALYRQAEELNIRVVDVPMTGLRALSSPDNFIGIDPDKLSDPGEELVCLAHEMGHCVTGSFYTADSSLLLRGRQEQRAERWAIRRLVPLEELKALMRSPVEGWAEAAEYFQVTEEFLRRAVAFYRDAENQL